MKYVWRLNELICFLAVKNGIFTPTFDEQEIVANALSKILGRDRIGADGIRKAEEMPAADPSFRAGRIEAVLSAATMGSDSKEGFGKPAELLIEMMAVLYRKGAVKTRVLELCDLFAIIYDAFAMRIAA